MRIRLVVTDDAQRRKAGARVSVLVDGERLETVTDERGEVELDVMLGTHVSATLHDMLGHAIVDADVVALEMAQMPL